MKKILILVAAISLVSGLGYAQTIVGSAHDMSGATWNNGGAGELCIVCHTPHDAQAQSFAPLWNHTMSTATYTVYSGVDMENVPGQPDDTTISGLCLSCHDGTVGLEAFGGVTGNVNTIGAGGLIGTDLSYEHPIAMVYDATVAGSDGELYDPETELSGLGGTIEADMLFGTAGNATLECASCHDVHNTANNAMLVMPNTTSALCLTCHDK